MIDGYLIGTLAVTYLGLLFWIAWLGDVWLRSSQRPTGRPLIYALSIGVYCTSWTFFGSVGWASSTGYDFLAVYIGPILMFMFGWPLIVRIVRLAKAQNITSVADFLAARYGKSPAVAALVTLVAVVGTLPYIALQLRAIVASVETMLGVHQVWTDEALGIGPIETGAIIAICLAAFAILFGTRHIDATEHQDGLILAIATESLIKLMAFIAVGVFTVFYAFGSPADFIEQLQSRPEITELRNATLSGGTMLTVGLLSFIAILLLPRQFHVTVVENHSEQEIRTASWLLPLYLILINVFVVPIAAAGLLLTPQGSTNPDMYVLLVPLVSGAQSVATLAFIGGLSAATAMVIVEMVALSIMVCNGVVVPFLLRQQASETQPTSNLYGQLLNVRRAAIIAIMILCYVVYRTVGGVGNLAGIGLISFAAIAQLGPAFFFGLLWRRGTTRGAIAGIVVGTSIWAYTLVLPWIVQAGWMPQTLIDNGPFGLTLLRPQALFFVEFEPLPHGVFWSLGLNLAAYLAVSMLRAPTPIDRLQSHIFVVNEGSISSQQPAFRFWRTSITQADLQATAGRYLGPERAARSFAEFHASRSIPQNPRAEADIQTLRYTEHLLSSAIGAASARLVLSLTLRRGDVGSQSALKLLDDASEALQYNRDLLQSALDQVRHGISVFDRNNQLICWNRQFRELLDLPTELGAVGVPLDRILRFCAERGDFGAGDIDALIADRLSLLSVTFETFQERLKDSDRILEIRTARMPQGGIVTTYIDITDRVQTANALARANLTLEQRVRERTAELVSVNEALENAKSKADAANLDKTRFIAAASHDILQPLNAARLYSSTLLERKLAETDARIAQRIDASLSAVEEILRALVDLSRMDAGRLTPDIQPVSLFELLNRLRVEFEPVAQKKGIGLKVLASDHWVMSDRQLLRRVLQNLIANAIKYTKDGRVLVGTRRRGDQIELQVIDTGPGIPLHKQGEIFKEFHRLDQSVGDERGLGLGLSIVDRIGQLLGHHIDLRSVPDRGTCFFVRMAPATAPVEKIEQARTAIGIRPLAGTHVLCIDNEPSVLDGMRSLLGSWDCKVTAAASADEAIALLTSPTDQDIDVILADYHLDREQTGVDAVRALRRHLCHDVAAAIITADHSGEVRRAIQESAIPVLRKPVKAAALRALVTQLTRNRIAAN
ncbi:MAG: hybrid sensor histidine kinase/response regulator [Hyphomicrobiaceae bacterium]